jgi:hypothetical protein
MTRACDYESIFNDGLLQWVSKKMCRNVFFPSRTGQISTIILADVLIVEPLAWSKIEDFALTTNSFGTTNDKKSIEISRLCRDFNGDVKFLLQTKYDKYFVILKTCNSF